MGTITKLYVSSNVLVGPSNCYLGLPAPSSHTPPTSVDEIAIDANGQPTTTAVGTITGATNATPIVCSIASTTGLSNSTIVSITGAVGNTGANGTWTISSVVLNTSFTLVGSAGNGVWSSGGAVTIGQHLGLTQGPTAFTVTPKFEEIRADQFESPIDGSLISVEAEIDMVLKEYSPLTLQRWFTADTLTNPQSLGSYASAVQIGGQFTDADNLRTLMVISPDRKTVGKWIYVFMYRVYLASSIQLTFHRSAQNEFKLKFKGVCDFTRQPGDELCCQVRTK